MSRLVLASALVLGITTSAAADQAEWVPRPVADREAALLRERSEVIVYCAPCTDQSSVRVRYAAVRVVQVTEDGFEVEIDGEPIDAAYTYVEIGGVFRNLARAVGYDVDDVPDVLEPARVPPPSAATPAFVEPTSSLTLDERCTITYGRDLTRTCRYPSAPDQVTAGGCEALARAQLDTSPGEETVLACELADRSGMIIVLSGAELRFAQARWEYAGQRVSFADVVANGAGVRELVIETGDEDGSSLDVIATRGGAWLVVLSAELGGGMADHDFSRTLVLPNAPTTTITAQVVDGRRRRTERYRWNERTFRFERRR